MLRPKIQTIDAHSKRLPFLLKTCALSLQSALFELSYKIRCSVPDVDNPSICVVGVLDPLLLLLIVCISDRNVPPENFPANHPPKRGQDIPHRLYQSNLHLAERNGLVTSECL
jgi:hypothetical protein